MSIANALSLHLAALDSPTPVIQFENAPPVNAPAGVFYVEAFLPAETIPVGLADDSSDDNNGLYQVTVMAPRDQFKAAGNNAAEAVIAHFRRAVLTNGDARVKIHRAYRSSAFLSGDRWAIPVTIGYRSFSRG